MTDTVPLAALLPIFAAAALALACGLKPRRQVLTPVLLPAAEAWPGGDPDAVGPWELP